VTSVSFQLWHCIYCSPLGARLRLTRRVSVHQHYQRWDQVELVPTLGKFGSLWSMVSWQILCRHSRIRTSLALTSTTQKTNIKTCGCLVCQIEQTLEHWLDLPLPFTPLSCKNVLNISMKIVTSRLYITLYLCDLPDQMWFLWICVYGDGGNSILQNVTRWDSKHRVMQQENFSHKGDSR
jgi:hypothetical protein